MTETTPVPRQAIPPQLPGLDCGLCGLRTCADLAARLDAEPQWIERCIHLSADRVGRPDAQAPAPRRVPLPVETPCGGCAAAAEPLTARAGLPGSAWVDTLGRPFDFYLEHFPEDPGRGR